MLFVLFYVYVFNRQSNLFAELTIKNLTAGSVSDPLVINLREIEG
jgi:hypothetical protein